MFELKMDEYAFPLFYCVVVFGPGWCLCRIGEVTVEFEDTYAPAHVVEVDPSVIINSIGHICSGQNDIFDLDLRLTLEGATNLIWWL